MNNQQLYLAWLRTFAPSIYTSALRRATGQVRTLGGLADDLVQQSFAPDIQHSFLGDDTSSLEPITVTGVYTPDPITTDFSFSAPSFDTSTVAAPSAVAIDSGPSTVAPSTSTSAPSSTFANILTAVTAIGAGVLNASNQSKLISLNTTRAQQGLPPVDATGRIVSGTGFATTSPGLLAFERAISGGTSGSMLLPILAVLGIGAFFVFRGRQST